MQVGHARITFCNYFLSSDSFPLPFWPSFGLAKKPKLQATGTILSPTDLTMPPKRVSPTNGRAMFKPHFGHSPRSPQQTSKQWQDEALRSLKPCFCDNFAPALASRHFWLSNSVKFRENVRNLNAKSLGSCHGLNILVKRHWKRATRSPLFLCIETWWVQLLWLRLKIRWASFHTVVCKIKYVNSWWWSRQYQQHAPTKPETRLRMQIWTNCFEFPIVGICSWRSVEPSPRDPCPSCSARCAITELSPMKANCCCKFFGIEDSALWRSA